MNACALEIVDGMALEPAITKLLQPGDRFAETERILPRFFYAIPSWEEARATFIAPHFKLSEIMTVDCRESRYLLKTFPHYLPCAAAILALALENFRREIDAPIFVSANGGYRSPAHLLAKEDRTHCWGTAADIYRVGTIYLDHQEAIRKYAQVAESLSPAIRVRPYQEGDDHLHLDLGPINFVPEFRRDRG